MLLSPKCPAPSLAFRCMPVAVSRTVTLPDHRPAVNGPEVVGETLTSVIGLRKGVVRPELTEPKVLFASNQSELSLLSALPSR